MGRPKAAHVLNDKANYIPSGKLQPERIGQPNTQGVQIALAGPKTLRLLPVETGIDIILRREFHQYTHLRAVSEPGGFVGAGIRLISQEGCASLTLDIYQVIKEKILQPSLDRDQLQVPARIIVTGIGFYEGLIVPRIDRYIKLGKDRNIRLDGAAESPIISIGEITDGKSELGSHT